MGNFEASLDCGAEGLELDSDTSFPLVVLLYHFCYFGGHNPRVFSCVGTCSNVENERCLGSLVLLLLSRLHDLLAWLRFFLRLFLIIEIYSDG